jgi:hypothetical protein
LIRSKEATEAPALLGSSRCHGGPLSPTFYLVVEYCCAKIHKYKFFVFLIIGVILAWATKIMVNGEDLEKKYRP